MNKTPDEIKMGLECCENGLFPNCIECPYTDNEPLEPPFENITGCTDGLEADALAYIQQLEAEKKQLLEDLADHCGSKTLCKKYEDGTCPHEYDCTLYLSTCEDYEWRGLQEDETDEIT